jgi:hypothetical protein
MDDGVRARVDGGQAAPVRATLAARRRREPAGSARVCLILPRSVRMVAMAWWLGLPTVAPAARLPVDLPQESVVASRGPELTHNGCLTTVDGVRHE